MPRKQTNIPFERPFRIFYRIVAGPTENIHFMNLEDLIIDQSDLRIRKIDSQTLRFIEFK